MLSALLLALTFSPPADGRFSVEAPDGRGPLYLAGSFNDWQPGDPSWELTSEEERWILSVPAARLGDAPIEFKLTRGS